MPKTIFTGRHAQFVEVLVEARQAAGLTQTQLAEKIGRDQSYVSLIERCQRRVDIVEFISLAEALSIHPLTLFEKALLRMTPPDGAA